MEKSKYSHKSQQSGTSWKKSLAYFFIALLVFASILHPLYLSTRAVSYARLLKYSLYFITIILGSLYTWQRIVLDVGLGGNGNIHFPVRTADIEKACEVNANDPKLSLPLRLWKFLVGSLLCLVVFGFIRMRSLKRNTLITQFDNFSFMVLGSGAFLFFALLFMDCVLLFLFGCKILVLALKYRSSEIVQNSCQSNHKHQTLNSVVNILVVPRKCFSYWRTYSNEIISPMRRAVLVIAVTVGVTLHGLYTAHRTLEVNKLNIPMERLPLSLEHFTIVQVSDFHIGPWLWLEHVSMVVDRVNALDPDIIVIVGDLIDLTLDLVSDALEPLKKLKSRKGIYFVSGNHDYYLKDIESLNHYLKEIGIVVLNNTNVRICAGESSSNDCFYLIGTEDYSQWDATGENFPLFRAMDGVDPRAPSVLLTHQPLAARKAILTEYEYNLILSGHTHGGQFFPVSLIVYMLNPYYHGLYHVREGTYLYVSNGVGFWGIPMRLFAPPEIAMLSLVPGQSSRG